MPAHPMAVLSNSSEFSRAARLQLRLTDMAATTDYVADGAFRSGCRAGARVSTKTWCRNRSEVRALSTLRMAFDERCLRYSERPSLRTPVEQVRQPIYRDGVDQWRHFEQWLEPLERALGPVLQHYPAPPPGV